MWLAIMKFLALQTLVWGAKIRRGKVPGYLQIKLKAESFVDPLTTVGEFGGAKLFDSGGECISCKSPMMWSLEATPSKKGTVNSNVVPGQNISFPVNENSAYDVMLDIPLSALEAKVDFSLQILSSVAASGTNSPEEQGRQVKSWSVSLLLHSTQQKAFVKTGVTLSGDFSHALMGESDAGLPEGSKELHVPSCLRPDTSNYTVTELSITMKRFAVTVACAAGYKGQGSANICLKAGEAYSLAGCISEACAAPSDVTGYKVNQVDLTELV
ncbi:Uncharacterized protein SCF082_LOCUS3354 [Durusdinium trenchii]|uniref:Uncharacterized protein n=1 Tax=Durusdinium trenchii TaxID=1381693 RepID=A0ABP0HW12_9DINO